MFRRLAALLFATGTLAVASCTPPGAVPVTTATAGDLRLPLPDFKLTERSGKAVTKADFAGHVWVASFVFTRCSGPCPAVTATVARLQSELAGEPNVRFVTFTVDPDRDDPTELKKYADRYRADPARWLFLTGPEADVHTLMQDGFKVAVMKAATPKPGEEYDHSTRLVVVDKAGNVRGYFDGMPAKWDEGGTMFEAGLSKLKAKVAELAKE